MTTRNEFFNNQPSSPQKVEPVLDENYIPEEPEWIKNRQFLSHDFLKQTIKSNVTFTDLKSLPAKVQEYILIEELLNVLVGYEGKYIQCVPIDESEDETMFEKNSIPTENTLFKFKLNCEIDSSVGDLVNRILPLCDKHAVVCSFIEKRSSYQYGVVCHAFCSALRVLEKEYMLYINQIDVLFKKEQLSLQKLYYHLQNGAWKTMEILERLTNEIVSSNAQGGALLNAIHKVSTSITIDDRTQKLFNFILGKSCVPYFEMIEQWIFKGIIVDTYNEFLIEEDQNLKKENLTEDFNSSYWDLKYTIKRECPFFLTKVSDKMLTCGKYLNVLRECGQKIERKSIEKFNYVDGKALSIIEDAHQFASETLLKYMLQDMKLLEKLRSMKHYFLFDHGDFFVHFMDTAEQELSKKSTEVSLSKLQSAIEFAAKICSIIENEGVDGLSCSLKSLNLADFLNRIKQLSTSNRLESPIIEKEQNVIEGYEAFCLEQKVEWPITLLITKKNLTKFQILFRQLFCFKYAERCLFSAWVNHKFIKDLNLGSTFSAFYALRHKMIHFIQNFLSYALVEVVERNFIEFEKKAKQAKNLDEVMKLHDQFLDSSLNGILVSSSEPFKCLTKLLSCCILFSRYMNQFSLSLEDGIMVDQENINYTDSLEKRRDRINQASELAKQYGQDESYKRSISKFTTTFDTTLTQLKAYTTHIFSLSFDSNANL
ncbi:hypothetical protein ABK040_012686 [Willaertia magna]